MNRTYEAMLLLDNREVKKGWQNLKEQVCGVFQKHGAEIKSARRWDERRLAYPVKHQLRGTYILVYFDVDTDALKPIRRDLEYSEPVLRYLTMVCESVPEQAFEPESEFDESQVKVEDTATARAAIEEAPPERPGRSGRGGDRADRAERAEKAAEKAQKDAKADADAKAAEKAPAEEAGKSEGAETPAAVAEDPNAGSEASSATPGAGESPSSEADKTEDR